jgi:hypothetical protein
MGASQSDAASTKNNDGPADALGASQFQADEVSKKGGGANVKSNVRGKSS